MFKRRWVRPALLVVAVVILARAGVYLIHRLTPGVSWGNCRRIHSGITHQEVEALLGRTHAPLWTRPPIGAPAPPHPFAYWGVWSSEELEVIAYFGPDRRVISHDCTGPLTDSFLGHVRQWINWEARGRPRGPAA
jgi:hypothetical protein